ncbi:MAG: hypothetical protein KKF06_01060, partial [Candidatus Margulisbacteria bacterium]|nr:hypothetical protein [Candidatus Margulisiibacteriota bacterium]
IVFDISVAGGKYEYVPGLAIPLFILYYLVAMGFAFYKLFKKFRGYKGVARQQVSYVFLGFFLGSFFPIITNLILPALGYSQFAAVGPLFTIITIAFIAYAITKSRLMDISVVISRAAAEVLGTLSYVAVYLLFVWYYRSSVSDEIGWLFLGFNVVFGIITAQTYHQVRLFIQTTSDKLILHGKYDYYKALEDISIEVTKTLSMNNVLSLLLKTFSETMEVSNPKIYTGEDFGRPELQEFLSIHEITCVDDSLVIPCRLENRLIAIILLGKKLSEEAYTEEDMRLLSALAGQAAVAIDHTRTFEEIKNDFEANKQKLFDTERLLARSERIASLANLIREYNHEIKTPLSIIRGEAALLTKKPRDQEYLVWFQKLIFEQVDRADDIVESTLRLSAPKERKLLGISLNEVIDRAVKLFPVSGVHLDKQYGDLPEIKGDTEDLQLVFINLMKNAVEAMPAGGNLTIKTYLKNGEKPLVCAEVTDTGAGIAQENIDKIFEPFFSTHVTKGRGLGLSLVFRIIREHLGKIEVKSEVGKGTTMLLSFPLDS